MIPMKKIDDIFQQGEHQKELDIRPELWDKLERHLDEGKGSLSFDWRPLMVAASSIVLISMTALLYLNIDSYELEDMSASLSPYFYKEEIANLESVYHTPQKIFVNPTILKG